MKIGVVFPQTEIYPDAATVTAFGQAIEDLGFDHLVAYDHVIGANIENRPGWNKPYTHTSAFCEPLVLFSYLAGVTKRIEFATGVLVVPQRQTALVAKQAANLDILCNGRLRMGLGVGWNTVEYEALGASFSDRGARLDEQMDVLRKLWTEGSFSFSGRFHTIEQAGLCPLPQQRPIPLWVGGIAPQAMRRAAKKADGWLPVLPANVAQEKISEFREQVRSFGRDPAKIGVENIIFVGQTMGGAVRGPQEAAADCAVWRDAGATHVSIHSMGAGFPTADDHIAFFRNLMTALRG